MSSDPGNDHQQQQLSARLHAPRPELKGPSLVAIRALHEIGDIEETLETAAVEAQEACRTF